MTIESTLNKNIDNIGRPMHCGKMIRQVAVGQGTKQITVGQAVISEWEIRMNDL